MMIKRLLFVFITVFFQITPSASFAYKVAEGNILDSQGKTLQLRGVNWFGAETSDHVVHGLWARNWKSMINQMKSLGFNAVRLPVCPDTLAGVATTSINTSLNPDLLGLNSLQILDRVIQEFDLQGLYILLDHHRLDCNAGIPELWYSSSYSEQRWISDLTFMANRYKNLSHFLGIGTPLPKELPAPFLRQHLMS